MSSPVNHILRGHAVPDTWTKEENVSEHHPGYQSKKVLAITSEDNKLILSSNVVDDDFGVNGDNLFFGREGVVLLEFEITNRSRQSKIP